MDSTYMLVNQHDSDILSFLCESLECLLDRRLLRFLIHDQEVLLRVGGLRDMTDTGE